MRQLPAPQRGRWGTAVQVVASTYFLGTPRRPHRCRCGRPGCPSDARRLAARRCASMWPMRSPPRSAATARSPPGLPGRSGGTPGGDTSRDRAGPAVPVTPGCRCDSVRGHHTELRRAGRHVDHRSDVLVSDRLIRTPAYRGTGSTVEWHCGTCRYPNCTRSFGAELTRAAVARVRRLDRRFRGRIWSCRERPGSRRLTDEAAVSTTR